MTCFNPIPVWQSLKRNPNTGKSMVVFSPPSDIGNYRYMQVPCGQCIGCRLDYSRQWAMRCYHETKLHKDNCFVTLTYNDECVPWSSSSGEQTLKKRDLQLFWKRLRKRFPDNKIRYFASGEYGEATYRPHYHAIIFGLNFGDKLLYKRSNLGFDYYISPCLDEVWGLGNCAVANVSWSTCAYVARYVLKKCNGEFGEIKYDGIEKEFSCMSRRPGIGKDWLMNHVNDVYGYDEVVMMDNGRVRKMKPCRFYDNIYDTINHERLEVLKCKRLDAQSRFLEENAVKGRFEAKEEFKKAQLNLLKRGM